MSELARHYEEIAFEEDELAKAGICPDPPLRRAAPGFELAYFRDVFKNRMRRNALGEEQAEAAFEYGCAQLRMGLALCESPIEQRILHWLVFGKWSCRHPLAKAALVIMPDERLPANARFAISPQMQVGPYRLDFAILTRTKDSIRIRALECDGLEFHNPARDRVRDESLILRGVHTIRATGSEIFRKPQDVFDRIDRNMPVFLG